MKRKHIQFREYYALWFKIVISYVILVKAEVNSFLQGFDRDRKPLLLSEFEMSCSSSEETITDLNSACVYA